MWTDYGPINRDRGTGPAKTASKKQPAGGLPSASAEQETAVGSPFLAGSAATEQMHEHRRRPRIEGIETPIVDQPKALTMARPSKLTSEATDRYCKAIAAGAWPEIAARFAGFSAASYYRYMRGSTPDHAAFRVAALKAQTELEIRLSGTLVQGALVDPKLALTVLERRFSERWARRSDGDLPVDDGRGRRRSEEELVTLDPALVETLVPRLLEAGRQLRTDGAEPPELSRFVSRSPGRRTHDDRS